VYYKIYYDSIIAYYLITGILKHSGLSTLSPIKKLEISMFEIFSKCNTWPTGSEIKQMLNTSVPG